MNHEDAMFLLDADMSILIDDEDAYIKYESYKEKHIQSGEARYAYLKENKNDTKY